MKLVENAKHWHKFWSVRLNAAGVFILGTWLSFAPDIINWWHANAAEYFPFLSANLIKYIGLFLIIAGQFARFYKQANLEKKQ